MALVKCLINSEPRVSVYRRHLSWRLLRLAQEQLLVIKDVDLIVQRPDVTSYPCLQLETIVVRLYYPAVIKTI